VLDLSKVEAGKHELQLASLRPDAIVAYLRRMFDPAAAQKGLAFDLTIAPGAPEAIYTDNSKLTQILKNLVSNAIKFTARGSVSVHLCRSEPAVAGSIADAVTIAVSDTGIGIPTDKQNAIFEAFTQADVGTSRKYGGTGLGLTIARQLAAILGGELKVKSEAGQGSTFSLVLPCAGPPNTVGASNAQTTEGLAGRRIPHLRSTRQAAEAVADDRNQIEPGQPWLLVVEDDPHFGAVVLQVIREAGFKAVVVGEGRQALDFARDRRPNGVILDVGLPDMDGWSVMAHLKQDVSTRDIPVHFVTAGQDAERARRMGAVGFMTKPVEAEQLRSAIRTLEESMGTPVKRVLLVDHDSVSRDDVAKLLAQGGVHVDEVTSEAGAIAALAASSFGCMVLNLALPDKQTGFELLRRLRADPSTIRLPVVVHTGLPLTRQELARLESDEYVIVIVQGERSVERVLEETRLFLHQVRNALPEQTRSRTDVMVAPEAQLVGKTVLIVDDDMRNVYSLSNALRAKGLRILTAADGQEALDELSAHPDTNAVLMDVMMPRMDGHEATRRLRAEPRFQKLPIIALTAKTMPGERERCLSAGANDYVPKPVDLERLFDLLRVWLN
jgi:CheY-like chemotaxis protein